MTIIESSGGGITDLSALNTITSIGGDLLIASNDALANLDGLDNITLIEGNLFIQGNAALANLCGIKTLLDANGLTGNYVISGNGINPTQTDAYFNDCTLGVDFFNETFSLYPNPVTDGILRLNTSENKDYKATVLDGLGNVLIQGVISRERSIDFSGLARGVYFVKISYENQSTVKKIIR